MDIAGVHLDLDRGPRIDGALQPVLDSAIEVSGAAVYPALTLTAAMTTTSSGASEKIVK